MEELAMRYLKLTTPSILRKNLQRRGRRELLWRSKFDGKDFICPRCTHEAFYQHNSRARD
jgi:hypothetical protein